MAAKTLEHQLGEALMASLNKVASPGVVGEAGPNPQKNRGIYQRTKEAVRYLVSDIVPATWFSPNQPLTPIAQETAGRQWDYPVGYNLRITPRQSEAVGFYELRSLADSYDLLRLLIETRKDQLAKVKWSVLPVDDRKGDIDDDPRAEAVEAFLRMPNRRHTWQQWLRQLLEEMLVTDAATIYPRLDKGGKLYSLDLVDGTTIKPVIDAFGRVPEAPNVAYQQIIKGVPASDFSIDDLIYAPRNLRVQKVYGYSPVEQITMTVNIALRRQLFQLQYYTEGSIPDLIMTTPENWTPQQIREFDENWNVMLRGDTGARRGAKWAPHGTTSINVKEGALKDEYDEWLARVCCFAFSVNPQPFVKQMNRATAETAQLAALQEGLIPLMQWVEDLMNIIIWKWFGFTDLRFGWQDEDETDPNVQSEIDDRDIKNGSRSVDEVRIQRGDDPIGMGAAVYTQNGPIMLKDVIAGTVGPAADIQQQQDNMDAQAQAKAEAQQQAVDDQGQPLQTKVKAGKKKVGTSGGDQKVKGEGKREAAPKGETKKLAKADSVKALGYDGAPLVKIRTAYADELVKIFADAADFYTEAIAAQLPTAASATKLAKADWGAEDDLDAQAQRIVDKVDYKGWGEFHDVSQKAFERAAAQGGLEALANVGYGNPDVDMLAQVDKRAVDYAKDRGAAMVGMTVQADGTLAVNPNPAWAIDESTRAMLRGTVVEAVEQGWSHQQLKTAITSDYAFSAGRAKMVARTELNTAFVEGNMAGYKAAQVPYKRWVLGDLHGLMDPCDANAEDGVIGFDEPFSSGDMAAPAHPNCVCTILPVFSLPKGDE